MVLFLENVPSAWNGVPLKDGSRIGRYGFASYIVKIKLPVKNVNDGGTAAADDIGIYFRDAATSYRIFIKNQNVWKRISSGGNPSSDRKAEVSSYTPTIERIPVDDLYIELLFEVSNWTNDRGGLWNAPYIGYYKDIYMIREKEKFRDFVLIGCLIIISLYNLTHYFVQRNNDSTLYLFFFCIIFAVRTFLSGLYFQEWFPDNRLFSVLYSLSYLTMHSSLLVFTLFIYRTFTNIFRREFIIAITAISSGFIFITMVTPTYIFTTTKEWFWVFLALCIGLIIYKLFCLWKKNGDVIALVSLVGIIIPSIAVVNDLLYTQNVLNTGFFAPHGFIVFIIVQGYAAAKKQLEQEIHIHELKNTIDVLQINFEKILLEKTNNLQEALREEKERIRREQNKISKSSERKVLEVISYIENNFTFDIAREGLAAMVDMSPSRLGKAFLSCTGKKISEFINEMRINKSLTELIDTEKTILEIAYDSGFESLSTFNRVFYKCIKITPSEYREKYSKR